MLIEVRVPGFGPDAAGGVRADYDARVDDTPVERPTRREPALHSTRHDIVSVLKGDSGQPSGARATAQFALSMALQISAGLFAKSLLNVSRVDIGLEVDDLITFSVSPELNNYTPEESRAPFERIEDEISDIPGVTSHVLLLHRVGAGRGAGENVRRF